MGIRLEQVASNHWTYEDRYDVLLVSDGLMSSYIVFDDAEQIEEVFTLEAAIEVIGEAERDR